MSHGPKWLAAALNLSLFGLIVFVIVALGHPHLPRLETFLTAHTLIVLTCVAAVVWLLCAWGGHVIGRDKGRGTEGFVLGLTLGVLGLLIAALLAADPDLDDRTKT